MKITVTESIFKDQFKAYGRGDDFSDDGLSALFEYCEDCFGEDWELDVIALCCDFSEDHYTDLVADMDIDTEHCEDEEEVFQSVLDELEDSTMVVYADEDSGMIMYADY